MHQTHLIGGTTLSLSTGKAIGSMKLIITINTKFRYPSMNKIQSITPGTHQWIKINQSFQISDFDICESMRIAISNQQPPRILVGHTHIEHSHANGHRFPWSPRKAMIMSWQTCNFIGVHHDTQGPQIVNSIELRLPGNTQAQRSRYPLPCLRTPDYVIARPWSWMVIPRY